MAGRSLSLDQSSPMMELNTTPLIDVLLVLLVMLIITIPPQAHSLRLDLPQPFPGPPPKSTVNLLEITGGGALLWNGQPITREALRYDLARTQQMHPTPELPCIRMRRPAMPRSRTCLASSTANRSTRLASSATRSTPAGKRAGAGHGANLCLARCPTSPASPPSS